jgi:hypothetical protein
MASVEFKINDQWTDGTLTSDGQPMPEVWVKIEEVDGKLLFTVEIKGDYTGDLRAFYFDLANDSLISSLSFAPAFPLPSAIDSDGNADTLANDAELTPLAGDGGNFDVGIQLGDAGDDGITTFSFTLSAASDLSLADISNQTFGVRVKSVDDLGTASDEGGSSKIIELIGQAPLPTDDEACVDENASAGGNVLDNDSNSTFTGWVDHADGDVIALADAEGATLTLGAGGSYVLDASTADKLSQGEHMEYTFQYTVSGGEADVNWSGGTATFTVCVDGVNDGPDAQDDDYCGPGQSILENATKTGAVLGNDSDIDRLDTIAVSALNGVADGGAGDLDDAAGSIQVQLASGALVTMDGSGNFTYDTNGAFVAMVNGEHTEDSFQYTIADDHGATDSAAVTVCIDGVGENWEGLSQGYWKTHGKDWDIGSSTSYESYFGVSGVLGGKWVTGQQKSGAFTTSNDVTFKGALDSAQWGSAQNILATQAVAAVLNSLDEDVNYKYEAADIKAMVQEAMAQGDAAMLALGKVFEAENTLGLSS